MTIEAFPLYWPEGRARTSFHRRERARFGTSFARARDEVVRQIELLCGRYNARDAAMVISTNLKLRHDGIPLASQRQPDDPGVAVYFNYKKRQVCFACDRWDKIEDNMQAIAKTIDALRGVARWGTGDMMESAFRGFAALPNQSSWSDILGVPAHTPTEAVRDAYRARRSQYHPDKGGNPTEFDRVEKAWAAFQQERGLQ